MPHELGHEQITCWDGTQADDYDSCPEIEGLWTPAGWDDPTTDVIEGTDEEGLQTEGWVAPSWWNDPDTPDENEYESYIYNTMGGMDATGLTQEMFWEKHGDKFPTWEESGYKQRYAGVLEQIGMLNTSIELANNVYDLELEGLDIKQDVELETALTKKEDLGGQVESQFMDAGGAVSGRRIEKVEEASENVNQALTLGLRGINLSEDLLTEAYKGDLMNIEKQRINYRDQLIGLEDQFEDKLLNLIQTMDIQKVPMTEDDYTLADSMFDTDDEGVKTLNEDNFRCTCVDGAVECSLTTGDSKGTYQQGADLDLVFSKYSDGQVAAPQDCSDPRVSQCEQPSDCPDCDKGYTALCTNGHCDCLPEGAG